MKEKKKETAVTEIGISKNEQIQNDVEPVKDRKKKKELNGCVWNTQMHHEKKTRNNWVYLLVIDIMINEKKTTQ